MKREMKSYTWIAMTVMLVWSVALFSANTYNNKTDNSTKNKAKNKTKNESKQDTCNRIFKHF